MLAKPPLPFFWRPSVVSPRRVARRADIAKIHVISLSIPLSPLSSGKGSSAPVAFSCRAAQRSDIAKTDVIALAIPLSPHCKVVRARRHPWPFLAELRNALAGGGDAQDIAFSDNGAHLYHEARLVELLSLTQISRSFLVCFDVAFTRHVCGP